MNGSARDWAIEQLTFDLARGGCSTNDTPRWAVDTLLSHPEVLRALAGTLGEVGRCGARAPSFTEEIGALCSLHAGHAGWHRDKDLGTEWGPVTDRG